MNEVIKCLINRASTRAFKNEMIKDEELNKIIEAGLKAPSGMNLQTPIFIVFKNKEELETLRKVNASILKKNNIDPFYGASVVILVIAKKEGTYLYDGSCAIMNMLNACESLNIGACWIHRAKEELESEFGRNLLQKLHLEGEFEGIGHIAIGYKEKEATPKKIGENRVFFIK